MVLIIYQSIDNFMLNKKFVYVNSKKLVFWKIYVLKVSIVTSSKSLIFNVFQIL